MNERTQRPTTTLSVAQVLCLARTRLRKLQGAVPGLEAEVLLAHVLRQSRTHLIAWPEQGLHSRQRARFETLIQRRLQGEPLAYLTGVREFWSLPLRVTPATLIPRPETEQLVERALELIPREAGTEIADLGTGSGAIAAAVASERPGAVIFATDIDSAALAVAQENFQRLNLSNITCLRGEWCAALPLGRRFGLILGNPPYVAEGDPHLQQNGLPWEPAAALTAGCDGLSELRRIILQAPAHLKPGGWLILEHGFEQGTAVRRLLQERQFQAIRTLQDLAHQERFSEGRMASPT